MLVRQRCQEEKRRKRGIGDIMKINKSLIILSLFLLAFIGGAMALPDCTLSTPSTNTNRCMNGATNTLTATCTGISDGGNSTGNVTSIEFLYRNTSTGVWYSLGVNASYNLSTYTLAFDTSSYVDTASGYLNVSFEVNGSDGGVNFSNIYSSTIEIDNTAPTASITLTYTDYVLIGETSQDADASGSTDGIDTSLTYSQVLRDPQNVNTTAETTASVTYTEEDMITPDSDDGYCAYVTVTDNCGNTDGEVDCFSALNEEGVAKSKAEEQKAEEAEKESNMLFWGILFGAIILVVVIIVISQKSKK